MEPSITSESKFTVGTRSSDLAKVQTFEVIDMIIKAASEKGIELTRENFPIFEIKNSIGDQDQKTKLFNMGGTGVFCKQLEQQIIDKNCNIGVHSMKDLPTTPVDGLVVVAIPDLKARDDVVILKSSNKEYKTLDNLPEGSKVGTSSLRRICTLKKKHPHLEILDIRGNLNTRFRKLEEEEYDAIILAKAGVVRLGWEDKIDQVLTKSEYEYPPAQGSLAVQCREDDPATIELLKLIDNPFSRRIVEAERQYLKTLEGGCTLPISVNAHVYAKDDETKAEIINFEDHKVENCNLILTGSVFDRNDFSNCLTHSVDGDLGEWIELGTKLANDLRDKGAKDFVLQAEEFKKEE
ncbi:unnamed protein product [Moneuplotes crassus]|uniref:hydroxymethylbilane synthase n=1 Tax=Euplotes crassus TaxID=5936 RepID=A0AAD1XJ80_EUPCR|nr:unnamed protein product [Moneuplotes crassus]